MKSNSNPDRLRFLVLRIVEEFPEIGMIYFFGSQATETSGPLSDYDFGIYLNEKNAFAPETRAFFSLEMAKKLHTNRVDAVILNRAPIELSFNVISHGKIIYERNVKTRVDFESYIMSLYFDYLPVLRSAKKEILEGGDHETRIRRYREAFGRTQRTLSQIRTVQE